jgi:hypothetical protein
MKNLVNCGSLIKIGKMMVVVAIVAGLNVATSLSNAQGRGNPATTGGGQIPPGLEIISEQFGFAPAPKTGMTTDDVVVNGDDGELQNGITWPNPRFTDNQDGTITDNLTGLIWLQDANRFGTKMWSDALNACNSLYDDGVNPTPTLTDGSIPGDWRLPNIRELHSLVNYGFNNLALSNTAGIGKWTEGNPFTNVKTFPYWSSTTSVSFPSGAWTVHFITGFTSFTVKTGINRVWCVRGP